MIDSCAARAATSQVSAVQKLQEMEHGNVEVARRLLQA